MTRYERRQFFDRLVQLRALYKLRGPDDSTVAISIDAVVEYAGRIAADADALAAALGPEASRPSGSSGPTSRRT